MTCDKCKKKDVKGHYRHFSGEGFLCSLCTPIEKFTYDPKLSQKVYLKGYGYTSQARLNEMERRVIIPHETGYYVGRRNENGTISEKRPRYI